MIRAAVAGLGWWGKIMIQRMKPSEDIQIVLAVDPSPNVVDFATQHGVKLVPRLEDALADPSIDAVIRCTPSRSSPQSRPASMSSAKSRWR
jgi:predicted dehydrogenase